MPIDVHEDIYDLSRGVAGAPNHARYFLALLSILSDALPVAAQESDGRIAAGAGVVGFGLFDDVGRPKVSPGLTGWLDFSLTPRGTPRVDFVRTVVVVPGTTLYRGPEYHEPRFAIVPRAFGAG